MFLRAKPGDSLFQPAVAPRQQLTAFDHFHHDLELIMFQRKDV